MKQIKSIIAMAVTWAVTIGYAGDSAPFRLDTALPPAGSLSISWDASWIGGDTNATVVIKDNGTEIKRTLGVGDFVYTLTGDERHYLTYTTLIGGVGQSEVYTATVFKTWKYDVVDDGAVITKTTHTAGEIIIPDSIDGYIVKSIGASAFSGCSGLTGVTIPGRVTSIGSAAFSGCSGLTSITIPNSVTNIGASAFSGCSGLEETTLPFVGARRGNTGSADSLFGYIFGTSSYTGGKSTKQYYKSGSYSTYYIPSSLKKVTLTDETVLGYGAFYNCSGLTSITIPASVTSIGDQAFYNCSGLTSITIPDSVTSIGASAFSGCGTSLFDTTTIPGVLLLDGWVVGYTSGLSGDLNFTGVRGIGSFAFSGCSGLTSVTIPNSVTSIGASAFSGCSGLGEITLPFVGARRGNTGSADSLFGYIFGTSSYTRGNATTQYYSSDSYSTYYIPSGLKKVTLTDETELGYGAFYNCNGLTSVTIPDNVTSIGNSAFSGCSGLTSVTIPYSVTSIGDQAFYNCSGITGTLTIPVGTMSIGEQAFKGCSGLTSFVVAVGNPSYRSESGLLLTNDGRTLVAVPDGLACVAIPAGVRSVDADVFSGHSALTSATIPNSVTNIGASAFSGCSGLEEITLPFVGARRGNTGGADSLFGYIFGTSSYTGGNATTQYYSSGSYSTYYIPSSLKKVTLTDETVLGYGAFYNCRGLTSVTILDGVTNIGERAFYNCSGLARITVPNSVTNIGASVFSRCSGLEEITLPFVGARRGNMGGADSLFGYIFGTSSYTGGIATTQYYSSGSYSTYYIPSGLKKVTLTDETALGYGVFYNCNGLTSVTIPDNVASIGASAFSGCSGLTSITMPNSVTSVGASAFYNCSGLTGALTIPVGVTSIGEQAFKGCSGLTSFAVAVGNPSYKSESGLLLTNDGRTLVAVPVGLTSVTIPNSVTSIGASAFSGCSGLTGVTIPGRVTSIGSAAFSGCSGLTSVTIPNSVTNIGASAFSGCSGLEETTLPFVGARRGNTGSADSLFGYIFGTSSYTGGKSTKQYYKSGSYSTYYIPSSLKKVTLTDETVLGYGAFYNCSGLTSITIPNSVTSIGDQAFYNCSGLAGTLTMPAGVTSIGDQAFYNCSGLAGTLTMPAGVTSIGDQAFYNCSGITNITIPGSVTSIGASAFSGCSGLTSVTIPNSVTSIGASAFYNCSGLTGALTIPVGVTSIGEQAFKGCSGLTSFVVAADNPSYKSESGLLLTNDGKTLVAVPAGLVSVVIPAGVTSIGASVFSGYNALTSVTIPNSVTSIGDSAFSGCSGLVEITLPFVGARRGNTGSADSLFGYIFGTSSYTGGNATTQYYSSGSYSTYYIPSGLKKVTLTDETALGYGVFYNCNGLTSVTIPDNVMSIGERAFYNCSGLISITIPDSVTSIGASAFSGCGTSLFDTTTIPGVLLLDGWVVGYTSGLSGDLNFTGVRGIGSFAFSGCSGITRVTIPNSVTNIGASAFSGFSGLTSVTIPDSVTSIGASAFSGCSGLTSVTLPNSVKNIGDGVFSGCSGLEEITLPFVGSYRGNTGSRASLFGYIFGTSSYTGGKSTKQYYKSSSYSTYYIPSSLKKVTLTDETVLGYGAFYNCSGLTSITIPNSVTNIGASAFYNCSGLTSITIPNSVTSIGASAFYNCSGLANATIPNSVTSIGSSLFSGCRGLASITIPNSVTSIGASAFYNCSGLTSIAIPDSVTSIGASAFSGCSGLASITIPNSVTSVGASAFSGCSGLTSMTMPWSCLPEVVLATNDWQMLSMGSDGTEEYQSPPIGHDSSTSMSLVLSGPYALTFSWKVSSESGCDCLSWYLDGTEKTEISGTGGTWQNVSVSVPTGEHTIKWEYSKDYTDTSGSDCGWVRIPKITSGVMSGLFPDSYTTLQSVTLTGTTTGISAHAFEGCAALTSIEIPSTVTNIGAYAFAGCSSLAHVTMPGWFDGTLPENVFESCPPGLTFEYNPLAAIFNANGGSVEESSRPLVQGEAIGALPVPTRTGYTFAGWWTAASGGTQISASTVVDGNVRCYAHWTINQYTVTFNANGGTGGIIVTQDYGTALSAPTVSRAGYTFAGWFPNVPSTMPAGDVTCTAQWMVRLWNDGPYWAETNIGAEKPEDSGYYFWWGDTVGYKRENNKWVATDGSSSSFSFIEWSASTWGCDQADLEGWFSADGALVSEHDAANVLLGGDWRMPTKQEFDDLNSNCDWTWATVNGVNGYLVRGRGDYSSVSIFLPCVGCDDGTSFNGVGSYGAYWSSLPCSDYYNAWSLYFNSGNHGMNSGRERYFGQSVRPVKGCTATFDANGGMGGTTRTGIAGFAVGTLPMPTRSGHTFAGWWTEPSGGTQVSESTIVTTNVTYYAFWVSTSTHDKVQLWAGGPYWATTNIGAENPEDYGYYFWWGDIVGYRRKNNKWVATDGSSANFSFSSSNTPTDNKYPASLESEGWITADEVLVPAHDAAHVHWGGDWRMPTSLELNDLKTKCDWTWTTRNNVQGYVVKGKGSYASKSIFLPGAGLVGEGTSLTSITDDGSYCSFYWSSVPCSDEGRGAWSIAIPTEYDYVIYMPRLLGLHVRPVGTANQHAVVFNANGGSGSVIWTRSHGATVGTLPTTTREGHTFAGWWTAKTGGTRISSSVVVNADVIYYAHWTINQYTMTFNGNGGTGGKTVTQNYGTALSAPTVARTGYTFTGWSPEVPSAVPASNVTYTAQWQANQYMVTFNAGGGEGGTLSVAAIYDSAMPSILLPTYAGYTFVGYWTGANRAGDQYYNADGTSARAWDRTDHETVLYAYWRADDSPLPLVDGDPDVAVVMSDSADSRLAEYVKTVGEYDAFVRWVDDNGLDHKSVKDSSRAWFSYAIGANGLVERDFQSGDVEVASVEVLSDRTFTFKVRVKNAPIDSGAKVANLATLFEVQGSPSLAENSFSSKNVNVVLGVSADGQLNVSATPIDSSDSFFVRVRMYADDDMGGGGDAVVDPVETTFSVTFDANGGDGGMTRTVASGASVGNLPTPTLSGYMFGGWFTAENGGVQVIKSTVVTTNVTYYAHWILEDSRGKVRLWEGGPYWATANIGAENSEDAGYYFWWGDTIGYKRENDAWVASDGSSSNFSFGPSNTLTYNKDIDTLQSEGWITADGALALEHDAAHVHWGGNWRLPTEQEIDDLNSKCDWTWTTMNGVNGYLVHGRGGYASNSIFLPAAGFGYETSLSYTGSFGYYWSSVPESDGSYVYDLYFNSGSHGKHISSYLYLGQYVRPVQGCWMTVSFEANGGEGGTTRTVAFGDPVGELPTPTRVGYAFEGWFTAESGGTQVCEATVVTSNVTYYARWTEGLHNRVRLWKGGPYWATTNIGAENPEDYGYYFWWGDTVGYRWENNKWVATDGSSANFSFRDVNAPTCNKDIDTLKDERWVTQDGVLDSEHDAAHVHWGGNWRLPTEQEIDDLNSNCDWTWTTMNGVDGYLVRGRGDYSSNSIFLPAVGRGYGTSLYSTGSHAYYWSSVPDSGRDNVLGLYIHAGDRSTDNVSGRHYGQSVRPVQGYVLTFDGNGGLLGDLTLPSVTNTQDYGSAIVVPVARRTGYTFMGWSPEVAATVPASNVTYTAQWQINQYIATFNANGGTGGKSVTQNYGTALSAPTVTRTGYTFTGWVPEVAATIPASNVTYTAQWMVQLWEGGPYWAETNIGAENPEDSGYYFWWGDTVGYTRSGGTLNDAGTEYSGVTWVSSTGQQMSSSPFSSSCPTYGKDNSALQSAGYIDSTGNLAPEHDAAHVHWGGDWRMPTQQELYDLSSNCDWTLAISNGVPGYVVKGKGAYAAASIFLPAVGCVRDSSLYRSGSRGYYWSSTPNSDYSDSAWFLYFESSRFSRLRDYRRIGQSVRPVRGYVVMFNANGGTGGTTRTILPGANVGALPTPTREGYTFTGWWTAESGGARISATTVPASNVTYYAHWKGPTIDDYYFRHDFSGGTNAFIAGEGTSLTRDQLDNTDTYAKAVEGPDGPGTAYHPGMLWGQFEDPTVLHGAWSAAMSLCMDAKETGVLVSFGRLNKGNQKEVALLSSSTKSNLYFKVMTTNSSKVKSVENTFTVVTTNDLTQGFHSVVITYTPASEVLNGIGSFDIYCDGVLVRTVSTDTPKLLGSDMGGMQYCHLMSGGNGLSALGAVSSRTNDEVAFYDFRFYNRVLTAPEAAMYASVYPSTMPNPEYIVTFDANGGEGGTTRTILPGANVGALPTPMREGYTFTGWWTAESGGTQISVTTVPDGKVTYYAHWTINYYTVTFDANGGTGGKSVTQNYGTALSAPTVTRTGYTFTGWSPEVAATVPASNVTYTAQWHINQYTATFDANGGEGGKSVTQNYGTALSAPTVTRTGYTFAGWLPEVAATVPASNVTYTAQWATVVDTHDKVQLWEGGPYWATTNIGAEKPEDSGYYFWWGDTVGYKRENNKWVATDGSSSNFSFETSNTPTYNKDVATLQSEGWITADGVLAPAHDAAHVHWGGDWRMPTDAEFSALINNCTTTWITTNGVSGRLVTGKGAYANRSIFLPAVGFGYASYLYGSGSNGYYWSSTPDSDNSYYAWRLYFNSGNFYRYNYNRYVGQSVRPVRGFAE